MARHIANDPVRLHAAARPNTPAMVDLATGRRLDYAGLDAAVEQAAGWLVARLGPASGERVAMLSRGSLDMAVLHLACVRAGTIFVPLNWRLAVPELSALLADAAPALLVHETHFADCVSRLVPAAPCLAIDGGQGGLAAVTAGAPPCPPDARRAFDAPTLLLYTSGTSGRPKGVIVTESMIFWGCSSFCTANAVTRGSVFLCDMPMFHTAGLVAALRSAVLAGATALISQGFDAPVTLARLQDPALAVSHYFCVPQMAQRLWLEAAFDPDRLRHLVALTTGGAPNPAAQVERWVAAGLPMVDGFGMSETCSTFGMPLDPDRVRTKAGSCGLPFLCVEARVVDDDGRDLPDGAVGELWLRGPNVTPGYWNRPEETARAFVDGWFRTGDAARRDGDGFFWLVDRRKDMFISGGENVYPAEVEAAIAELAGIAEVAVIGMPDERWGEVGCAHVILAAGSALSAEAIIGHCRGRLAGFKVPKAVVFPAAIPRTASGKVQKHLMRTPA